VVFGYLVITVPVVLCGAVVFCLPCVLVGMRWLRMGEMGEGSGRGVGTDVLKGLEVLRYVPKAEENTNTGTGTANVDTPAVEPDLELGQPAPRPTRSSLLSTLRRLPSLTPRPKSPTIPSLSPDTEDATCVICLSHYEPEELLRRLPCGHHFHKECVDEWLGVSGRCPLCVRGVTEGPPEATGEPARGRRRRRRRRSRSRSRRRAGEQVGVAVVVDTPVAPSAAVLPAETTGITSRLRLLPWRRAATTAGALQSGATDPRPSFSSAFSAFSQNTEPRASFGEQSANGLLPRTGSTGSAGEEEGTELQGIGVPTPSGNAV